MAKSVPLPAIKYLTFLLLSRTFVAHNGRGPPVAWVAHFIRMAMSRPPQLYVPGGPSGAAYIIGRITFAIDTHPFI